MILRRSPRIGIRWVSRAVWSLCIVAGRQSLCDGFGQWRNLQDAVEPSVAVALDDAEADLPAGQQNHAVGQTKRPHRSLAGLQGRDGASQSSRCLTHDEGIEVDRLIASIRDVLGDDQVVGFAVVILCHMPLR